MVNAIYKYDMKPEKNRSLMDETIKDLLKLMAPFAPHFAEEMWETMGEKDFIFNQSWPTYDEKALVKDEVEIAVQFNGQIKFRINVPADAENKEIEEIVKNDPRSAQYLEGKNIVRIIVVKGRLVNIVVK